MEYIITFFFGSIGGFGAEILIYRNSLKENSNGNKRNFKGLAYFFATISQILLGGIVAVAYLYDGTKLGAILAMNVGATAPILFGQWAKSNAPTISNDT